MKLIDKKFFRFILVGIVNTIVGTGIMFVLYNIAKFSYWSASAANYIVGGIVSFFLNKFFTFEDKQFNFKQVVLFILVVASCYLIAYVLSKKIIYFIFSNKSEKLKGNIALLGGMVFYTLLNYILQRLIVFSQKNKTQEVAK